MSRRQMLRSLHVLRVARRGFAGGGRSTAARLQRRVEKQPREDEPHVAVPASYLSQMNEGRSRAFLSALRFSVVAGD